MNPLLLVDSYKVHHYLMYPEGMTKLYSNFTPRKSRIPGIDKVVVFGIQHFILEYLIKQFDENFFQKRWDGHDDPKGIKVEGLKQEYNKHLSVDTTHIEALWSLGYLPIEFKALEEGTLCPIGVPMLTITNTHPDFGWLVNYLETLISCMLWQPVTSATIAYQYKKILTKYCLETDEKNLDFINWQGHDFSMRGMSSPESAILSGMGHLTSFTGTDTIPAIYQLENSYKASGLIGASVPATEHSVMCMGQKESEIDTFRRLLELYPTGILSVVSDTWDLWKVCTEYLPQLKEEILARDGKLVIRPDSGDPVDIICGINSRVLHLGEVWTDDIKDKPEFKGVIELLWEVFGGTTNNQGYKVLHPHIGAIYGDSITMDRAKEICERLKAKGFASTNIVLGIGSYTYQYNTRDTFGFAMKATYGEVLPPCTCSETAAIDCGSKCQKIECREIFKDPITDDGTKKSRKGLLNVGIVELTGEIGCCDQRTWEQENQGLLQTVFKDGKLIKETTLEEIRNKLK